MKSQTTLKVIAYLLILAICGIAAIPMFQTEDVEAQTRADCENAWADCKTAARNAYDECMQNGWGLGCGLDLAQALLHCAEAFYDCLRYVL